MLCDICCDEPCVSQCEFGHPFCGACLEHYIDTKIGIDIVCFAGANCDARISHAEIRRLLPLQKWASFERRIEVSLVENFGLEACPFCPFAMEITESKEDLALFRCQAEGCRKLSCRKCRKETHWPEPCKDERLSAEEKLSLTTIHQCSKCATRFVKDEGCNKMTCPKCESLTCYQCEKDITRVGYQHFCQHANGASVQTCSKCTNCLLYGKEDRRRRAEEVMVDSIDKLCARVEQETNRIKRKLQYTRTIDDRNFERVVNLFKNNKGSVGTI